MSKIILITFLCSIKYEAVKANDEREEKIHAS